MLVLVEPQTPTNVVPNVFTSTKESKSDRNQKKTRPLKMEPTIDILCLIYLYTISSKRLTRFSFFFKYMFLDIFYFNGELIVEKQTGNKGRE